VIAMDLTGHSVMELAATPIEERLGAAADLARTPERRSAR